MGELTEEARRLIRCWPEAVNALAEELGDSLDRSALQGRQQTTPKGLCDRCLIGDVCDLPDGLQPQPSMCGGFVPKEAGEEADDHEKA